MGRRGKGGARKQRQGRQGVICERVCLGMIIGAAGLDGFHEGMIAMVLD